MEGTLKPFQHHDCWEICKGWLLFEYSPQHRVGPMLVFGTASLAIDGDEDGSPTIQETRVENPSLGEGSIPRENGKAKDDIAFQQEIAASIRFMAEQNVIAVEERNRRHEERAKQIQ
ncbi:hypothetical protein D8674_030647 [Pyrus ussuriensis x Pyrus communis]|uniref:Uncharacterized protein n=1 Tax=Pyrus ussuriensis x Pyrus communis TaxID=2448454 RepID=A0A5N5EWR8_9ROSA|nr:hypothetical protein D8674_030647 [Pyrus ussuriensis x Pyrus communis]